MGLAYGGANLFSGVCVAEGCREWLVPGNECRNIVRRLDGANLRFDFAPALSKLRFMKDANADAAMRDLAEVFPIEALPRHPLRDAAWRHVVGLGNGLTEQAAKSYMNASFDHRRALLSLRSRVRYRLMADLDFGSS